jgi:hypothetical protein
MKKMMPLSQMDEDDASDSIAPDRAGPPGGGRDGPAEPPAISNTEKDIFDRGRKARSRLNQV